MMGFNLEELSYTNPNAYSIYHRGAASRQVEIDELKKEIAKLVQINETLVAYKNQLLDELEGGM